MLAQTASLNYKSVSKIELFYWNWNNWFYIIEDNLIKYFLRPYFTANNHHFLNLFEIEISSELENYEGSEVSSPDGLEVEHLLHKLYDSTSVGSNPALPQNDFRNNSNIMGGTLVNNVQKLKRSSLLD